MEIKLHSVPDVAQQLVRMIAEAQEEIYAVTGIDRVFFDAERGFRSAPVNQRVFWLHEGVGG